MDVRYKLSSGNFPSAMAIIVPFAFIFLGEALLFAGDLEGCATVHILNILICVLAPILLKQHSMIWQSFMLVSLLRALNLAMPRFDELTILWMPLIYAPIVVVGFLLIRDESRGLVSYFREVVHFFNFVPSQPGWKIYYIPLAFGIALLAANIEFVILNMTVPDLRLIPELSFGYLALLFGVMVFFVGLGEELVFRYVLQSRLHAAVGIIPALLISSVAFALMHSGYTSLTYMLYVFGISLMLGLLFHRTKSLALITLVHGALNFFLFSFLPFGYLLLF